MLFKGLLCALSSFYGFAFSEKIGNDSELIEKHPPLLVMSFDGFRADYLKRYSFPNLQKFFTDGVLVDHLTNVFVTKTFPNHYSLATGLYAESHGMLASRMYDRKTEKQFSLQNVTDPFWWNEATPIWVSVQEYGYKSAAAMWPGTDIMIQNRTASYFLKYDHRVTFQERVGNITKWLTEDKAVRFAAMYWEEPDFSGHRYGPDNTTLMGKALKEVDDHIGLLIKQLNQTGLWGKMNVIVTSDHGMVQCSQDRLIRLDQCLSPKSYKLVDIAPATAIIPLADPSSVFNNLSNCDSHMKAYFKEDIPDRLHYRNNDRIQPILLVADEGWTIVQNGNLPRLGDHGYDNSLPSMHPLFAAHGPAFRRGYRLSSFNNVDLYPLMCHLVGIPEKPNNGSFWNVRCMLVTESCVDLAVVVGIVIGVLIFLTTITFLFRLMKTREMSSTRPFARLELQDEDDDDPLLG